MRGVLATNDVAAVLLATCRSAITCLVFCKTGIRISVLLHTLLIGSSRSTSQSVHRVLKTNDVAPLEQDGYTMLGQR